jgi:hypothetical protein
MKISRTAPNELRQLAAPLRSGTLRGIPGCLRALLSCLNRPVHATMPVICLNSLPQAKIFLHLAGFFVD